MTLARFLLSNKGTNDIVELFTNYNQIERKKFIKILKEFMTIEQIKRLDWDDIEYHSKLTKTTRKLILNMYGEYYLESDDGLIFQLLHDCSVDEIKQYSKFIKVQTVINEFREINRLYEKDRKITDIFDDFIVIDATFRSLYKETYSEYVSRGQDMNRVDLSEYYNDLIKKGKDYCDNQLIPIFSLISQYMDIKERYNETLTYFVELFSTRYVDKVDTFFKENIL